MPEDFRTRIAAAAVGLALVFALGCAQGQDLQAAQACTRVGDNAARLSCYDTAMGRLGSAPPTAAVGTDTLHSEAKPRLPKSLSAHVREVISLPAGLYRLALDNGQVWETTQADTELAFKANDAVTISRGSLGSHQISLAGHNTSVSVIPKQ
jgi:hypothetical protein